MATTRHHGLSGFDEFLAAVTDEYKPSGGAAFAAAILGEDGSGGLRDERVGGTAGVSHDDWLDVVAPEAHRTRRSPSAPAADEFLYEYNPDEPRDERGRWTTGVALA